MSDADIAVIGAAGRFPSAPDLQSFWEMVVSGRTAEFSLTAEAMAKAGVSEAERTDPNYVACRGILDDVAGFDADLFGLTAREARLTDPQFRVLLECGWEALDAAAHDPVRFGGLIGVYAGTGPTTYNRLLSEASYRLDSATGLSGVLGIERDFLAARLAFHLGLGGPAVTLQTACSTSLVAVHTACIALLSGDCDLALAGGSSIILPQAQGYLYAKGAIGSARGQCRPFDAAADGTLPGNGAGLVVLRRLEDARADRDDIWGIIRGSAINNDGADKLAFSSPSTQGQAAVIENALRVAEVDPASISFVETHGTATRLGDAVEIAALARAYGDSGAGRPVALGTTKANVGHLDAAAGVTGLIKTLLAMRNRTIPPCAGYSAPNPDLSLSDSRFTLFDEARRWDGPVPRRAGVSSFGLGGTNAHMIVEEAEVDAAPTEPSIPDAWHVVPLSANTGSALTALGRNHASWLRANPGGLGDLALSLQSGRRELPLRRAVLCQAENAEARLNAIDTGDRRAAAPGGQLRDVTVVFPGQVGFQPDPTLLHVAPGVTAAVERRTREVETHTGLDIMPLLARDRAAAEAGLDMLNLAQYATQCAVADAVASCAGAPAGVVGHSFGEFAAMTVAGVLSFADGAVLVRDRARLITTTAPGAMLALACDSGTARRFCPEGADIAAQNAADQTVLSGSVEAIDAAMDLARHEGIAAVRLPSRYAFHSPLMEPILPAYRALFEKVTLRPPTIEIVSTATARKVTAEEARDPDFWAGALRRRVAFHHAITQRDGSIGTALEIGDGTTVAPALRRSLTEPCHVAATLRRATDKGTPPPILCAIAGMWERGHAIDWQPLAAGDGRRRAVPSYPFERRTYWPEAAGPEAKPTDRGDPETVFHPVWQPVDGADTTPSAETPERVWVLGAQGGVTDRVVAALRAAGRDVEQIGATIGDAGAAILDARIGADAAHAHRVVAVVEPQDRKTGARMLGDLSALIRDLSAAGLTAPLDVVTTGAVAVRPGERSDPAAALVIGPTLAAAAEGASVTARLFDIQPDRLEGIAAALLSAPEAGPGPFALRDGTLLRARWTALGASAPTGAPALLLKGGVYVIVGGTGTIGAHLAQYLAERTQGTIHLIGRRSPDAEPGFAAALQRLRDAIDAKGGASRYWDADLSRADRLADVFAEIRAAEGRIDGVVHAAGGWSFAPIGEIAKETADWLLAPKLDGVAALQAAIGEAGCPLVVLCSSLSSRFPRPGEAVYAAANAALEAGATDLARSADHVVSILWGGWHDTAAALDDRLQSRADPGALLSTPDALVAFERILNSGQRQVMVSPEGAAPSQRWQGSETGAEPSSGATAADDAPPSDILAVLCAAAAKAIGIDAVKPEDDLLALGLDSITALDFAAEAGAQGVRVNPDKILAARTTGALLEHVAQPAPAGDRPLNPMPLTPVQSWFMALPVMDRNRYCLAVAVPVERAPSQDQLQHAVEGLVQRHGALQLRFRQGADGAWCQDPTEPPAPPICLVSDGRHAAFDDVVDQGQAELSPRLDINSGPLVAAMSVQGEDRAAVVLAVHHLVCDVHSLSILASQLTAALAGQRPLSRTDHSWAEWVGWLEREDDALAQGLKIPDFLAYPPTGILPARTAEVPDLERDEAVLGPVGVCSGRMDGLRDAADAFGTDLQTLLLVALARALHRVFGAERFCIELEADARMAERTERQFAGTVGWFTSTFPVAIDPDIARTDSHPHDAVRKLGERVRRISDSGLGYGCAMASDGNWPRFDVSLAHFSDRRAEGRETGLLLGDRDPVAERPNQLAVLTRDTGDGLQIVVAHNPTITALLGVEALVSAMTDVLEQIAEPPSNTAMASSFGWDLEMVARIGRSIRTKSQQ